jgi:ABC-type Zn uptake system ZnuABC Zn-binding protein ZnuA
MRNKLRFSIEIIFPALLLLVAVPTAAADKLKIVASTTTLAYFAEQIGGDLAEVDAIAAGNRDLHYVEALPSYMLKLRKADVYLIVGLELDMWWEPLVLGSRNSKLKVIDCSLGIEPLEVPTFKADARYGDLHRFGNPHYWIDPDNVPLMCRTIADAMIGASPEHASEFKAGLTNYLNRFGEKRLEWEMYRDSLSQVRFIAYHNSWPYFCRFFGCQTVGFVEEYPGVAPSPSHLAQLIGRIKAEEIRIVASEPFHDKRIPEMLERKTGCRAIRLPESVGGLNGTDTYEDLIDLLIHELLAAHKG